MTELPTGTVTFLFTDIEGSTKLLQALGDRWQPVLEDHHRLMRDAIRRAGGIDLRTEGDSFFAVFDRPAAAVAATAAAQRALAGHEWPADHEVRVRMGMHTGEGTLGGDDYLGLDVHRAARIASAAHGGQVLLSEATRSVAEHDLPAGVGVQSLGAHRLKDLARPEQIFQLAIEGLPAEFPPIRSLGTPTNLPVQRTAFIGREQEVARVRELLKGPGLLTLTGPGGSGKTRLSLQAARELLDDYPGGVFFVQLEAITDPLLVPSAIAGTVGVRSEGARPILDILREHVRDREMLLVLDNFEQVLGAAPVVGDLLDAAPQLRVLATSREPLHVAGEQELAVPPLAESEAVGLFVQRAAAVDPAFERTEANAPAIAEICRRLDGLPLAIELAASRVKLLSPGAILERLGSRLELLAGGPVDLPARQRTLREAIAWSHDLLDESERVLFRRLAVFAGGWTLEAAEAVAGADLGGDALEVLGSLIDKSLVIRVPSASGGSRFGMLETIREFARERLEEAEEGGAVRDRHFRYFLERAVAAEPQLRLADQRRWLDELEEEHDNLRGALRWAADDRRTLEGLRFAAALWRFWHLHAHLAEGRRWLEEVLALPGAEEPTTERWAALTALGGLAYWQQDLDGIRQAYEGSLVLARDLGDREAEAEALYNMAYVKAAEGDFEEAIALAEESLARSRELGFDRVAGDCLFLLGIGARLMGDLDKAQALTDESLQTHRARGDRFGGTIALYAVGRVAFAQGDMARSRAVFLEALDHDENIGNQTGMAVIFENLGAQAAIHGDHVRAVRLGGAASALKEVVGGEAPPSLIDIPDPRVEAREVLGEAAVNAAWEEGRAMPLEQVLSYAREEAQDG